MAADQVVQQFNERFERERVSRSRWITAFTLVLFFSVIGAVILVITVASIQYVRNASVYYDNNVEVGTFVWTASSEPIVVPPCLTEKVSDIIQTYEWTVIELVPALFTPYVGVILSNVGQQTQNVSGWSLVFIDVNAVWHTELFQHIREDDFDAFKIWQPIENSVGVYEAIFTVKRYGSTVKAPIEATLTITVTFGETLVSTFAYKMTPLKNLVVCELL